MTTPDEQKTPVNLHEGAPRAIIGEIGNQIHNLGCENQDNEELSEALGSLASRIWAAAKLASPEPAAMPNTKALEADARENIVDEIESIICETHEMDVRDVDYAENIVSWLERHHPAALHAIDATYRAAREGKA